MEFETGAIRDEKIGKGRCDLMPLDIISKILANENSVANCVVLNSMEDFRSNGDVAYLYNAIDIFIRGCDEFETHQHAMLELSVHFEDGAKHYGEDNWKKGIPISSYIDSAVRHFLKWLDDYDDERHDRAVLWNLVCAIWTKENIQEEKLNVE